MGHGFTKIQGRFEKQFIKKKTRNILKGYIKKEH